MYAAEVDFSTIIQIFRTKVTEAYGFYASKSSVAYIKLDFVNKRLPAVLQ